MLSQQIHVQYSVSDQSLILSSIPTSNRSFVQSQFQIKGCADNCLQSNRQVDENQNCYNSNQMKIKLEKLYENYHQGLNQLAFLKQKYAAEENVRIEMKNKLEDSLNQIYKNYLSRDRKGSQNSTAGQDQQSRTHLEQEQRKRTQQSYKTMLMLEKKLYELKNRNGTEIKQYFQSIAQLKSRLQTADKQLNLKTKDIQQNQPLHVPHKCIEQKIEDLNKKKEELLDLKQKLEAKIKEQKITIIQLQNNTQYLRSTQSCCQQILNQELNTIKYKISARRSQYETTKKYMDKIIRCKKYQQNLSFKQIQNQIKFLNTYCDDMIDQKKQIITEIKKYKHKRHAINDQIKQNNEIIKQIQIKKSTLNQNIYQQNIQYTQLQDQYCLLIENLDQKTLSMSQDLSPQQKYQILNQKKQILNQQLKTIISLSSQAKNEIQKNQNLVPSKIIKELQKKIKNKKQQSINAQNILKEIIQLQTQNNLLNQQKDKIQWKINPIIQELIEEEKNLTTNQNSLKDSIKSLKQQSQNLQEKISKFQEYIKLQKQQIKYQHNQSQISCQKQQNEITVSTQQKRQFDGQKLMQKFRQKNSKDEQTNQILNQNQELNQSQRQFKKIKGKKGKRHTSNIEKQQKQMSRSKGKGFYLSKQNPIQKLKRKFPINSSQQTFNNSSLLESNPALWMFVIFVTVVIPGLCIGYNF